MTDYKKLGEIQQTAELLQQFGSRIRKLGDLSTQLGTSYDNPDLRTRISTNRENVLNLSKLIATRLQFRSSSRVQKLHLQRLAQEFQRLLQQFNSINGDTLIREKEKLEQEMSQHNSVASQIMFQQVAEFDFYERGEEVKQIETDMATINDMFKDVANLVNQQAQQLDGIETFIDSSDEQTRKALLDLQRAQVYQNSSKRKLYCIAGAVAVVLALLVLVMAGIVLNQLEKLGCLFVVKQMVFIKC